MGLGPPLVGQRGRWLWGLALGSDDTEQNPVQARREQSHEGQERPVGTGWDGVWGRVLGAVMASTKLKFPFCALKRPQLFSQASMLPVSIALGMKEGTEFLLGSETLSGWTMKLTTKTMSVVVEEPGVSLSLMGWKRGLFYF